MAIIVPDEPVGTEGAVFNNGPTILANVKQAIAKRTGEGREGGLSEVDRVEDGHKTNTRLTQD